MSEAAIPPTQRLLPAVQVSYLERSLSVRLLPAQIQLPQNGETDKEPVAEAVVVDQSEDVFYAQVNQGHDALQTPRRVIISKKYGAEMFCEMKKKKKKWTDVE